MSDVSDEKKSKVKLDKEQKRSKRKIRNERRKAKKTQDWDYTMVQCCNYDSAIGIKFCCCMPCAMTDVMAELQDEKNEHGCCYSCCCWSCVSARARQYALNRFRIHRDNCFWEFLKSVCFPCCSGAQIKNQLEYSKHEDDKKNAPKSEAMRDKKKKSNKKAKKKRNEEKSDSESSSSSDSDSSDEN